MIKKKIKFRVRRKRSQKNQSEIESWMGMRRMGEMKRKSKCKQSLCLYCRDGSASATYYFSDQTAAEIGNKTWLYLKILKPGERVPLRHEQVHCSRWTADVVTQKASK